MVRRFLAYGFLGWALEVGFTGLTDSFCLRDRRLRGHSYLWMLPIYDAGGLFLERLHDRLSGKGVPRWARSLAYMAGIYGLEFGSASLLNRAIGDVPWRYRKGINLHGYVRLDYAPFWYGCGWLFETLECELRKLDRPARKSWRPASGHGSRSSMVAEPPSAAVTTAPAEDGGAALRPAARRAAALP